MTDFSNSAGFWGRIFVVLVGGLFIGPQLSFGESASTKTSKTEEIVIHWHVAHGPDEVVGAGIGEFRKVLAERGLTKFKVITNDFNFKNREVTTSANLNSFRAIQRGEYEMGQIYSNVIGLDNQEFTIFDRPYFVRDYSHAESIFDGEKGQALLASLGNQGLVGGAFTYSGGMRILYFSKKIQILQPSDLNGLRVSYMGSMSNSPSGAFFKSIGFTPVKLDKELVSDSIASGKIDGFEAIFASAWIEKITKKLELNVYESNHSLHSSAIVFNKKFFDKLSPEDQKTLLLASKSAALAERKASKKYAMDVRQRHIDAGIKIRSLPPEVEKFMRTKAEEPKRLAEL